MIKKFVYIGGVPLPTRCLYGMWINGMYVGCGKCYHCRRKAAREWSFRIEQEAKYKYTYNCLLTYDDIHVPYYKGRMCVDKVDVQLFMKRFRYNLDNIYGGKVRFFLVGEYGGNTHRPHYHMLLFSDVSLEVPSWNKHPLEQARSILLDSWKNGEARIEQVYNSGGSFAFYMTAYLTRFNDGREYEKPEKPFKLMSSRPAIGSSWFNDNKELIAKMQKEDNYTYNISTRDGTRLTLPLSRYYRRKIQPEWSQIENADKYYGLCNEYKEYRLTLTRKQKIEEDYERKKLKLRIEEKDREEYRLRKVRRRDRNASQVFDRVEE